MDAERVRIGRSQQWIIHSWEYEHDLLFIDNGGKGLAMRVLLAKGTESNIELYQLKQCIFCY